MRDSCNYCETLRSKQNNISEQTSINTNNIKQHVEILKSHDKRFDNIENNINKMLFSTIAACGSVIATLAIILFDK